jgi:hypothetical protein
MLPMTPCTSIDWPGGWTEERTRHDHVAEALNRHLRTIKNRHTNHPVS